MSCLIVGCGFLGRRLGQSLRARGERVFGTTRRPDRLAELASLGFEGVVVDVLDPVSLSALPEVDRIFYCVGFDRTAGVPLRRVYVDGPRNTLQALAGKARRFVYASSTGVYGETDGGWVDEETPPGPLTESGRACLEAEDLILATAPALGIEPAIVRFSGLYGDARVVGRKALERGEPIVCDPSTYLNLIHLDDAALAAVAVLDRGAGGRVYLASDDRPVERREYYTTTAALLGAAAPRFVLPEPGRPALARGESNKKVSNRRIKDELGIRWRYPDFVSGLSAVLAERLNRP